MKNFISQNHGTFKEIIIFSTSDYSDVLLLSKVPNLEISVRKGSIRPQMCTIWGELIYFSHVMSLSQSESWILCTFEAESASFPQNRPQMCTAFSASFPQNEHISDKSDSFDWLLVID